DAKQVLTAALTSFRTTRGDLYPTTLHCLADLGSVTAALGQADEGQTLLQAALETQRQTLGENHPDVAATLLQPAAVLHDSSTTQAQRDQARLAAAQALAIRRKLLAADNPLVAAAQVCLAGASDGPEDREGLAAAVDILRQEWGPHHPL